MGSVALNLILKKSRLLLALIALATAPCVWTLLNAEFSPSIIESFVNDRQDYLDAMAVEELFTGNPDALLWVASDEGDSLFTVEKQVAIRQAARAISALEEVERVVALPDLARPPQMQRGVRGTTQKIVANAQLKKGKIPKQLPRLSRVLPGNNTASERDLLLVKDRLLQQPEIVHQFLSEDGTSHVMLVELSNPYDIPPFRQASLVQEIVELAKSEGLGDQGLYCSGLVALQAYAYQQIGKVLWTLLPLGGFLISVTVLYIFRRIEVVWLTLFIAVISICWGIALGLIVYGKFSVLLAAVPLMVLVISTADVIHLVSSYTAEVKQKQSHENALRRTFIHVGGACVLTSITTFVGFASLMLVPSTTIRQFGFSAAAGVASALLLSVLLVPLFLNWLAKRGRPLAASKGSTRITGFIANACLTLSLKFPIPVILVFSVLLAGSGYVASQISLDPDLTKRFPKSHPITLSTEFFEEKFGGINSVEIVIKGKPDELLTKQTFEGMERFKQECLETGFVTGVVTLAVPVAEFLSSLDFRNPEGIPYSDEHAFATVGYLEKFKPQIIRGLITQDRTQLRLLARIEETSYMEILTLSNQVESIAKKSFGEDFEIAQKGSAPLVGNAVGEIIRGHMQGFVICFTVIFFLIAFGLRSFKLGCLSVIPNLTPLLFLGGLVGWFSDKVDSDILAVATMGLGLAVDDTIHFLSRFKIACRESSSIKEALSKAMDHTGLAIIRTTLVLSIGFLPFAFSGYWSIKMLGTYLVLVLFSAVLADLVFLPAITLVVYKKATGLFERSHEASADC